MERMYTIDEMAKELRVSRRTVQRWISEKKVKAFHLGSDRLPRIWEREIVRFVRRNRP